MARALIAFEPPDGGVAEHVAELALGLRTEGFEMEVAGPLAATVLPRLRAAGIPVHVLGGLARGFGRPDRDARAWLALRRLVAARRPDLIHLHSTKAGLLGRVAPADRLAQVVYTPHCFGFVGDVPMSRRITATFAERILGRRTDALVCVCDAELQEAARRRIGTPDSRIRIYNGSEDCVATTAKANELENLPGRLVVGAIAVFRRQKALDVLIDAAPAILSAHADAAVVIAGEGPEGGRLEQRARRRDLLDHPRFRLLGFSPPSGRYLRGLDVFVLPSRWEAFPISLLEALACGVPQVATAVGGTGEAVTDETGVLVPPGDPVALAQAVVELLADDDRRAAMAEASRWRHQQLFRRERMITETAALYRRLLAVQG